MTFRKAERTRARIKLGISGPSGSGKTYSALIIAKGLVGDWEKIAVIDTENRSADLYSHLGSYSVCTISAPYEPQKYMEAIKDAEKLGFECIIIDSLSHAWSGEGGLLDTQGKAAARTGNSYTAWRDVTPIHNRLVETLLSSSAHIIVTCRAKTEYVLETNEKGKQAPRKVGMAPIFRDGLEYEMTLFFELDLAHTASASKDRTSLFDGRFIQPSEETGAIIAEWLSGGAEPIPSVEADKIYITMNDKGYPDNKVDEAFKKRYGYPLNELPIRYLEEAKALAENAKVQNIKAVS